MRLFSDNIIDFYYSIPSFNKPSLLAKVCNRLIQKFFAIFTNYFVPKYYEKTSSEEKYRIKINAIDPKIVASLTTFPDRITKVHLSIEGIIRQSVKPDIILLWLAECQFPGKEADLPESLLKLTNRGLVIKFCDDLRSHKKYYYTLQQFPNSKVILFDDDIFYHNEIIRNLINLNEKYPDYIIATRAHLMIFKENNLAPYNQWKHNYKSTDVSLYHHHTSGNGTLIPNGNIFDQIFFDKKLLLEISPFSDDVWFKVNLIRLNIPVMITSEYQRDPLTQNGSYATSLVSQNSHNGLKDKQLIAALAYFKISFEP
jgi:hypothetical protein